MSTVMMDGSLWMNEKWFIALRVLSNFFTFHLKLVNLIEKFTSKFVITNSLTPPCALWFSSFYHDLVFFFVHFPLFKKILCELNFQQHCAVTMPWKWIFDDSNQANLEHFKVYLQSDLINVMLFQFSRLWDMHLIGFIFGQNEMLDGWIPKEGHLLFILSFPVNQVFPYDPQLSFSFIILPWFQYLLSMVGNLIDWFPLAPTPLA